MAYPPTDFYWGNEYKNSKCDWVAFWFRHPNIEDQSQQQIDDLVASGKSWILTWLQNSRNLPILTKEQFAELREAGIEMTGTMMVCYNEKDLQDSDICRLIVNRAADRKPPSTAPSDVPDLGT